MPYQVTFFPDPYDTGIREVILENDLDRLLDKTAAYLRQNMCGYILEEYNGIRIKGMDRSYYREVNKRLGRF